MSREQKRRSATLYQNAARILATLAEERLNLDSDTRAALNRARGALEEFDTLRMYQPTEADK